MENEDIVFSQEGWSEIQSTGCSSLRHQHQDSVLRPLLRQGTSTVTATTKRSRGSDASADVDIGLEVADAREEDHTCKMGKLGDAE